MVNSEPANTVSNVPDLFTDAFIGRTDEINWLYNNLRSSLTSHSNGIVALHGITGVGKTQIILGYNKVYEEGYISRLFITGGSRRTFLNSLESTLETLKLPDMHSLRSEKKLTLLKGWLDNNTSWLLLIDDVSLEEAEMIKRVLPDRRRGHIILTSRDGQVVENLTRLKAACFEVKEMIECEAVGVLLNSGKLDENFENINLARTIARLLKWHPYALGQCVSYMSVTHIGLQEYFSRYGQAPTELHTGWVDSLQKTIPVSKESALVLLELSEHNKDAAALLRLVCLFDTEAIPSFENWTRREKLLRFDTLSSRQLNTQEKLFEHAMQITNIVKDTARMNKAIATLVHLGLARRIKGTETLCIHSITARLIKEWVPHTQLKFWIEVALDVLYHTFPRCDSTAKQPPVVTTYLAQARKMIDAANNAKVPLWKYASLMALCAACFLNRDDYQTAMKYYLVILPEYERILGECHSRTATVRLGVAITLHKADHLEEAEEEYNRVLALRLNLFTEKSVEVFEVLNHMAACIEQQGRLKEGEEIFAKVYNGSRASLRSSHPMVISSGHNLATCYIHQGRLKEAETLCRLVLRTSERVCGRDADGTLKTFANMAIILDYQGRLSEASKMYQDTLATLTHQRQWNDMYALQVRNNMSSVYRQQGLFQEAAVLLRDIYRHHIEVFGGEHFKTAIVLYDRAELFLDEGADESVRRILFRSLQVMHANLRKHYLTTRVEDLIGVLYREVGTLTTAERHSRSAYEWNKANLGENDPWTLCSRNNLAECLHAAGRYNEAKPHYEACLRGYVLLFGDTNRNPLVATVLNNMGRLSLCTARQDAGHYFRRAEVQFKQLVGEKHHFTLAVRTNIARLELSKGRSDAAVTTLSSVIDCFDLKLQAGRHTGRGFAALHLAVAHCSKGDWDGAHYRLREAAEAFARYYGETHPSSIFTQALLACVMREKKLSGMASKYTGDVARLLQERKDVLREGDEPVAIRMGARPVDYKQLAQRRAGEVDWRAVISLPVGETTRARWGRKTFWRTMDHPLAS